MAAPKRVGELPNSAHSTHRSQTTTPQWDTPRGCNTASSFCPHTPHQRQSTQGRTPTLWMSTNPRAGNGRTKEAHTCTQPDVTRCNDPARGGGAQDSQKQEGKCNKNGHLRDSPLCPENAATSLYRSELTLSRACWVEKGLSYGWWYLL